MYNVTEASDLRGIVRDIVTDLRGRVRDRVRGRVRDLRGIVSSVKERTSQKFGETLIIIRQLDRLQQERRAYKRTIIELVNATGV
jgi:hypothetical protein